MDNKLYLVAVQTPHGIVQVAVRCPILDPSARIFDSPDRKEEAEKKAKAAVLRWNSEQKWTEDRLIAAACELRFDETGVASIPQ